MPKIRYVRIEFTQKLSAFDIPKFRAAVIEKTNRQSSLFHNHKDDASVFYRYPLIQYKIIKGQASIICLNAGTEDIHELLKHQDMKLRIGAVSNFFSIEAIDMHYHDVQTIHQHHTYQLSHWLALNQKIYPHYQALENDETAQQSLLEGILTGNILSFAKGIDWHVDDRIQVTIKSIQRTKLVQFKGKKMQSFSLLFSCNVTLPNFIGLGKGSSIGFGVVEQITQNQNHTT